MFDFSTKCNRLSHNQLNFVLGALFKYREQIARKSYAVALQALYALANVVGIFNCDVVSYTSEQTTELEAVPALGNAGIES